MSSSRPNTRQKLKGSQLAILVMCLHSQLATMHDKVTTGTDRIGTRGMSMQASSLPTTLQTTNNHNMPNLHQVYNII